jgi:hypothetical protein
MGYDYRRESYERDRAAARNDRHNPTDRPHDRYRPDDRGFFDRAGDEVRSWFGDEEAERRRHLDERYDERQDRERGGSRYAESAPGGYRGPDSYPRNWRSNRDESRSGGYARGYAPYSTYYPSGAEDRQFADQPAGYGPGDSGFAGNRYGYDSDDRRREEEYRAVYGREARNADARRAGFDRAAHYGDPHGYHDWRSRQVEAFDRDYDEYRREHQSRFENEFGTWRQARQTQRDSLRQAKEHQEVLGSDGQHVGTVDHVRGDQILLTKTDKDAGGHHHRIPSSWIARVDDKVHLAKTADEAKRAWRDADETGGLFGDTRSNDGHTDLNRSFAGTYDRK